VEIKMCPLLMLQAEGMPQICIQYQCAWWVKTAWCHIPHADTGAPYTGLKRKIQLEADGWVHEGDGEKLSSTKDGPPEPYWVMNLYNCCIPEIPSWLEQITDVISGLSNR
jgi:hypothetical protein